MAFLRDLDQRYHETMTELYSGVRDMKDSAALHPIIIVPPDDPNKVEGVGNTNRLVPVRRVTTDEVRMSTYLTSPRGLKFLITQQLLQTGNTISETRIINPLFVNLNLAPHAYFNRHLFDQTNIIVSDPNRSPASTPEVGLAGRLQLESSAQSLVSVIGRESGRSVLSLIGAQVFGTLAGTIGIGDDVGTLGINERPEILIGPDKRFYSELLRLGYETTGQRELTILTNALAAAGAIGSTFGLPNIFSGITDGFVNPIPAQSQQMRYGPGRTPTIPGRKQAPASAIDPNEPTRYIPGSIGSRAPILLSATSVRIGQLARGVDLLQVGFGALSLGGSTAIRRIATSLSAASSNISNIFSAASNQVGQIAPQTQNLISDLSVNDEGKRSRVIADELQFPDEALQNRYEADDRLTFVRDALSEQAKLIEKYTENIGTDKVPKRGVLGGITLENLQQINKDREDFVTVIRRPEGRDPFTETLSAQQFFAGLETRQISPRGGTVAPGYYHDTLNLVGRLEGTEGVRPDSEDFPQDYINVTIFDKINDRLEPFRALIEGVSETTTPEFTETQYIGRIERNIVYLGAKRTLSFTLYVHAWTALELRSVWDKVNFITGLAFPSKISDDGFLLPPVVELTIGDMYVNQPGYFSGITHTVEEGTSWEIERDAQVPHRIQMQLSFELIEKESMVASSGFYGFGLPVTN